MLIGDQLTFDIDGCVISVLRCGVGGGVRGDQADLPGRHQWQHCLYRADSYTQGNKAIVKPVKYLTLINKETFIVAQLYTVTGRKVKAESCRITQNTCILGFKTGSLL